MAKILVVGDDIAAVDLMAVSAEGLGYEVVTLYESIDALECAVAENVDLVILEENMNVFNGFEVATAMRGEPDVPEDLPILIMTRNSIKPQDLERAGVIDTIHPEPDPATLRELLVHHIGE